MRSIFRAFPCLVALGMVPAGCDSQALAIAPPTGSFLVVANQRSGVATLVELNSGRVSHVPLGANPHEVAVSPDARVAALTVPMDRFRSGRRVLVLDVASARIVRTIELGDYKEPHGIEFLSDSVALIGTLGGTSAVFVDIHGGRILRSVERLPPNPYVVKRTATGRAYVSSPHSSRVTEIDVAADRVTRTLDIPDDPAGIAVSADGTELYAAVWRENAGGGIAIVDLSTGNVVAKLPATQPRRLTVTADQKLVIASDRNHLRIIDRATRRVRSVAVGSNAGGSGVACAPDSMRCYVALSQAGEIVEVDVGAARVLRRFAAQRGVDGVAYVSAEDPRP